MIRNDEEFKKEVFRRRNEYLRLRKKRISRITTVSLSLFLCLIAVPTLFRFTRQKSASLSEDAIFVSSTGCGANQGYLTNETVQEQVSVRITVICRKVLSDLQPEEHLITDEQSAAELLDAIDQLSSYGENSKNILDEESDTERTSADVSSYVIIITDIDGTVCEYTLSTGGVFRKNNGEWIQIPLSEVSRLINLIDKAVSKQ